MSNTAPRREPGKYDMWIEHGGIRLPYNIARAEGKAIQWFEGLAGIVSPEQNQSGFGYRSAPSYIDDPIELSSWEGGAGLYYERPGAKRTNRYSYTQHVDMSYGDRAYKSPGRVTSTDLTANALAFKFTPLGTFALVADEVWRYNTGTDIWESVLSSVTPTDIVAFTTYVVVFCGTNAYQYSTTGDSGSWTASTSGNTYNFGVVRSGSAGDPVLWAIDSTGAMSNATDITNASSNWTAEVQIGDTWEVVNGLSLVNDEFIIRKDTGLYLYDGVTKFDLYPAATQALASNGKHAVTWVDGNLYLNLGDALQQYDAARRSFKQVWPREGEGGHPELNGTIEAMGRTNEHLYFVVKNADARYYIMRGDPTRGFHSWVYTGTTAVTAIAGSRAGAIHASNPVVLANYGTSAAHYILPGPNLRPENDASCTFETTDGLIVWPWMDGGAALTTKFMTGAKLTGETLLVDTDAGYDRHITLSYALDGSSVVTDLVEAQTAGINVGAPKDAIKYTWLQGRATISTDSAAVTPVLKGAVFSSTPNPPRRHEWRGILDLSGIPVGPRGHGSGGKEDVFNLRKHLFNGASSRVLLYDRWGERWVAKLHGVRQAHLLESTQSDIDKLEVELFEMGESGYLSTWYGVGSKYLLPDMPGGASGLYTDTTPPTTHLTVLRPQTIADHIRWEESAQTHSAILFKDSNIPQGATIVSAYVRMRLFAVIAGTVDVDMYLEDADTGTVPASAGDAVGLTLTTATARWTQAVTGADAWYTWFDHTDMASVVQEVVDRAGYAPGADFLYVARQRAVTGNVYTRWFDTQILSAISHENFPELVIEWST